MTIEYGNSEITQAKRTFITLRRNPALIPRSKYYWNQFLDIAVHAICAVAMFAAGSSFIFFGVLLTIWTFMLVSKFRTYDDWLYRLSFPGNLSSDQKRIRLELADDGMREHQGDVVAFAPWKDVTDTMIEDDLLVIFLSSRQEALIPRKSFGISELNLEEIRDGIERRRAAARQ